MIRTVAPWVMAASAWVFSVASLPWALVIVYSSGVSPASCSALVR